MTNSVTLTECITRGMGLSTFSYNYDRFLINCCLSKVSAIFQQKYHRDIFSGGDSWSYMRKLLVICVVLLCVFTFWVPCCDIRYDFRI